MRRNGAAVLVALAAALAAAAPLQGQTGRTDAERPDPQPSVDLPPELARVLRDYERHWSAGEEDRLAALFVSGGLIVRRGSWIRGRDAIREAYRDASGPLRLRAIEYATSGDVGYIVGAYGYAEDPPVEDSGMFVLTLHRDPGGRWLIVSDMDRGIG